MNEIYTRTGCLLQFYNCFQFQYKSCNIHQQYIDPVLNLSEIECIIGANIMNNFFISVFTSVFTSVFKSVFISV